MSPLICLVALTGCTGCTTNASKLIDALSKDPATVRLRVTSIYGTVDFVRVGTTNGLTVSPDGTISVK